MTEPPLQRPFRVVVADDTPGIRLLMRHILEGSGEFEVVADAVDGQQAVDLAGELQPDVVLLDLIMPRLDGLEAIPKIRASSPSSRIVVLSGFSSQGMASAADGGADGYIEKRQRPDEILRVVLDVCRSGEAGTEPGGPPGSSAGPPAGAPAESGAGRDPLAAHAASIDAAPAPPLLAPVVERALLPPDFALAQVQALAGALARSRADLAEIGSAAAHDLKSPLQAILGFAHLLDQLYGTGMDDRASMFVRTIIEATDKMAALIEGLSVYCRVVSQRPEPASVKVGDLLAAAVQGIDANLFVQGAKVTNDPLPEIVGDPAQIGVVLAQLLSNAVTWVEAGTQPRVHVSAAESSNGWAITVSDNGVGIDPELRARVFGLFARLPGSSGHPGAGIGLALARRLVEGWGGTMWAEDAPGRGTRFTFTIPARQVLEPAPSVPAAEVRTPPPRVVTPAEGDLEPLAAIDAEGGGGILSGAVQQLLLVEDSEAHARLVAATLAEAPGPRYRLRHVVDLRNARRALSEQRIDCVLLDLSLPDGEGLDSLAQMRAMAPSIPIVVLTSRSDEALAVTAVQQGAQDYLVKGAMEPRTLGRSIRYAIERKALEAQLAIQALHDSLTGLPNRALLLDRLNPALARAARSGEKIALLYLDLDGFKPINDELGHEAGDEILVEVARRLSSVVRPQDTVSRIGGDEFAVLCEGFRSETEIKALAGRMAEAIAEPVLMEHHRRSVRASIGIAFAEGVEQSADDLIRTADQAMYREKRQGQLEGGTQPPG